MKEFEMYLNKEINLPKSVLITIDDGWRTAIATQLLEKYQLKAVVKLLDDKAEYERMSHAKNPYGDGKASERIADAILYAFGLKDSKPNEFKI
mgnify:CR=1 FL=1